MRKSLIALLRTYSLAVAGIVGGACFYDPVGSVLTRGDSETGTIASSTTGVISGDVATSGALATSSDGATDTSSGTPTITQSTATSQEPGTSSTTTDETLGTVTSDRSSTGGSSDTADTTGTGDPSTSTNTTSVGPVCGDGLAEGDEVCDGFDLDGETCKSILPNKWGGGMLNCNFCASFNYTNCCIGLGQKCNYMTEPDEACCPPLECELGTCKHP